MGFEFFIACVIIGCFVLAGITGASNDSAKAGYNVHPKLRWVLTEENRKKVDHDYPRHAEE